MAGAPSSERAGERRWELEDALRVLTRAEELRSDPKLMRDVAKFAKDKAEEAEEVAESLSKRGLISDKEAERLRRSAAKDD